MNFTKEKRKKLRKPQRIPREKQQFERKIRRCRKAVDKKKSDVNSNQKTEKKLNKKRY